MVIIISILVICPVVFQHGVNELWMSQYSHFKENYAKLLIALLVSSSGGGLHSFKAVFLTISLLTHTLTHTHRYSPFTLPLLHFYHPRVLIIDDPWKLWLRAEGAIPLTPDTEAVKGSSHNWVTYRLSPSNFYSRFEGVIEWFLENVYFMFLRVSIKSTSVTR